MTDLKCRCGLFHYNLQQYTKVHGKSKEFIDPYVQVPFANDQPWNEKDWDPTEPYPLIVRKWVCQFCGNEKDHQVDCSYLNNK